MVEIAEKENANIVAHGCTGKGNDQVRFEVGMKTLNPDLKIIAPLRDWEFKSREDEIIYAKEISDIPIIAFGKKNRSPHISHCISHISKDEYEVMDVLTNMFDI